MFPMSCVCFGVIVVAATNSLKRIRFAKKRYEKAHRDMKSIGALALLILNLCSFVEIFGVVQIVALALQRSSRATFGRLPRSAPKYYVHPHMCALCLSCVDLVSRSFVERCFSHDKSSIDGLLGYMLDRLALRLNWQVTESSPLHFPSGSFPIHTHVLDVKCVCTASQRSWFGLRGALCGQPSDPKPTLP